MKNKIITILISLAMISPAYAAEKQKRYKKPQNTSFSAKSYIIADQNGNILKEQSGDVVRPIASITKLVVGLIASEQSLQESLEIPEQRILRTSIPRSTKTLTRNELLSLALVKSDNFATEILCNHILDCVARMNNKVQSLNMHDTHFDDPTGLANGNVSTAHDLLKLLKAASNNDIVSSLSSMPKVEILTDSKPIRVNNTNPLTSDMDIVLSKTGTTNAAGGCLVMVLNSSVGQRFLILLGSKSGKTRISDMKKLIADL